MTASEKPAGQRLDRLRDRMLGAMLSVADERGISAMPTLLAELPWITLVALPDQGAGVALLDRGDVGPEELRSRLDRLLAAHAQGVMFLVLVGGTAADRAILQAADREAPDPNRLGVYHLDEAGHFERVAGRRSRLLAGAGPRARQADPVGPEDMKAVVERAQRDQQEAVAFATALEKRPQHATRLLGAACILYFVLSQVWGSQGLGETLLRMGGNSAPLVREGELWRLLSHAFLHGNFFHLAVNLIALISFGGFLEGLLGWRRYLVLYGLSALAGGIASALLGGIVLSVGASGAIWGLMAAGVGLVSARSSLLPRAVAARMRPRLFGVLALNTAFSLLPLFTSARIDLFAHGGGGLIGFALAASGLLTRGLPPSGERERAAVRIGAGAMLLLLAASVGLALFTGRPWQPSGAI
jgi:rhomboid protease GluP